MDLFEAEIYRLREELDKHNYNYYVLNSPTISDEEYDKMMRRLQELEAEHEELFDPLSPTQRVGSDLTAGFVQVAHERPMLSLSNTYSIEEVEDFLRRTKEQLGGDSLEIVGEMKFDGTSISLIYEHGALVQAVTRGDGVRGDDVTVNVKTIRSIPLRLHGNDYPDHFEVRGEIVMPWKSFDALNKEREYNEEPLLANPRNAAAGTLKTLNPAEVARRGLDAYFYYLLCDGNAYATHYECLQALKKWGFKVSETTRLLSNISEAKQFIDYWAEARKKLEVATDGLVFKVNDLRQQRYLGATAKSPRWAIAYKFQAERALTKLRHVSFETGRTGVITPVANLEPVLLSGTIVKRASLHNEDIIRQLDIYDDDYLYVEKGGEIIPKIVGVEKSRRKSGGKPVKFVKNCPVCGTPLVKNEGEAAWVCPNRDGCRPQITGRIEHFVGRRMMNIDGIGEETVEQLYDAGLVTNIADLYDLTENALMTVGRIGELTSRRIMRGIEASKNVPFERVVYALSIPNVGETVAKKIAFAVGSMDHLMHSSVEDLTTIDEIGQVIAESVVAYFGDARNVEIVQRLRDAGLQMEVSADVEIGKTDKLSGKTIVISGVFEHYSRDEYKSLIERNGGKNAGSISRKTDFVLAGANMGPAKLEKAKALGVPILNEADFLKMIEG
ncbi:MAG TPA: NAD-dependent DNA ligase LigA [Candidatus Limisoma intestinavium]|uniref:DNA ligase n=1 Tax=Candidatus Limisoma intestinavium TaxID=2840856 RepID=A0A9D1IJW8_9BACT|nr:NAD-dependent DNA ligase LigA [Candidatus Limisoma intestinavium]